MKTGVFNPSNPLETQGITPKTAHYNLTEAALMQASLTAGESTLSKHGALLVNTGQYTGRSPQDKFIVREAATEPHIWWENNAPMTRADFETLRADFFTHIKKGEYYVQDLFGGADPAHRLNVRVVNELAWHSLFIRHLLRRPARADLHDFLPEFTIINCPSFKADPDKHNTRSEVVVAISFEDKQVLIGGTQYAGETKKAVFSVLNYLLPAKGIMPMHCSANHAIGDANDSAVFFGLSGTGKTTLSADPNRVLLGDDEHGWGDNLFNFEGGCYAKTINLSAESEPEIFATTRKFATVIENVVFDADSREPDFNDTSITANARCAYPLEAISNASDTGICGAPRTVVMLTCDAFGVLPPIARLSADQAMYHFLSGFTSKVAGTERGVKEPTPTFSTCFGAPFMPRRPEVYGDLLRRHISASNAVCWLVNTGWSGGGYGVGARMPIKVTRALLSAALDGGLNEIMNAGALRVDDNFGFEVPVSLGGIDGKVLDPRACWADGAEYDAVAARLLAMFADNFRQYES